MDIKDITEDYNNLIIHSRDDIDIDSDTIMKVLNREPGKYLKDIYEDIEDKILNEELINDKNILIEYIIHNY
jgi:hypothetical protein